MENLKNNNGVQPKQTKNISSIILSIVITAILSGGLIYVLLNFSSQKTKQAIQVKITKLELELKDNKNTNLDLQNQLKSLQDEITILSESQNKTDNTTDDVESNDNTKKSSCSENAIDEIFFSDSLFCAYKRNIIKTKNGNEKIIYAMDEQMPGEILGKFEHTPDESTLLFKEMGGKMLPYLMAINLSTNEAKELDGYNISWSPNKNYALLTDGFVDGAKINISFANNLYSVTPVISVYAPTSWKSGWKDNETFYYEVENVDQCIEYAGDVYKEKGLVCGINEFKVKDYLK